LLTEVVVRGEVRQLPLDGVESAPRLIDDVFEEPVAGAADVLEAEPALESSAEEELPEAIPGGEEYQALYLEEDVQKPAAPTDATGEDLPDSIAALEEMIDQVLARHLAAARVEIIERLGPLLDAERDPSKD
jgi:hypothetical protein